MAIVRTAKGTVSGTGGNLVLANVTLPAGKLLVVGTADLDVAPLDLKWGTQELIQIARRADTTNGFAASLYALITQETQTKALTGRWPGGAGKKAMFATCVTETSKLNIDASALDAATGAPDTTSAGNSTIADTISFGVFVSNGPSGDTAATSAGNGHTLGQRVGTTGGLAASNVTIQETFEILTATGDIRASLTGATARDWASLVVAFSASQLYTVVDAYENLRVTDNDANNVIVRMESETAGDFVEVRLSPGDFDGLTDGEVTEKLSGAAAWHAAKRINNNLPIPEADAARNTRLATFVNDTVKV